MTRTLAFYVHGTPGPQGSKRHVGNGRMIESSKKVKPWRAAVVAAALDAALLTGHTQFTGPVRLGVTFYLPRPKSHYRTGRYADRLKPDAPVFVPTKPDLDKLIRSTCDALSTAGVWADDNQAARIVARKLYADDTGTGAQIHLSALAVTR